ncbi:hypothetical protein BcDW1_10772 [Botrytis cinerea BcDW1]|uniref:Uncharacterized protein n=1 Tax=Botryotinia fuckeliana (strain BcDW1) TaxID=1290391 RepID=M7UB64_BOTF1|nr:hypothetical protein BcDW1_10772 [Botrytis cinerea BcDW1]
MLKLPLFVEPDLSKPNPSKRKRDQLETSTAMASLEDQLIMPESSESTPENVKLSDRDKARQKRQEIRVRKKNEALLVVYGIMNTETEQTEADEKYGMYPCADPSPLRKCWTLVEEDGKTRTEDSGETGASN